MNGLTKWDKKRIRQALRIAICTEESGCDSYKGKLIYRKGKYINVVSKENKSSYLKALNNVKAFEKLLLKLTLKENKKDKEIIK